MSIPKDITAQDVLDAAIAFDAGGYTDWYGKPTGYEVEVNGKMYPPKAMVGLAARRIMGQPLPRAQFSGGQGAGQANDVLEKLGFTIHRLGAVRGEDWTDAEVRATVESYFAMLALELEGRPYSKTEYRRRLHALLPGRTEPSVEFKHANISAVLVEHGFPYIVGYQPRGNYQQLLASTIDAYLQTAPEVLSEMLSRQGEAPSGRPGEMPSLTSIQVAPPSPPDNGVTALPGKPRLLNPGELARRDASNRELGRAGEEYVLQLERSELVRAGRADFAAKVEWVSQTRGDGLGYDVHSFESGGADKRIEVKTTNGARTCPFFLSANELASSAQLGTGFWLYRLFGFRTTPGLFIVRGNLAEQLKLTPTQFRADWS